MSNAKDRAIELIEKFTMDNTRNGERNGIKCALIAVDELIKSNSITGMYDQDFFDSEINYWINVKNEIQKL